MRHFFILLTIMGSTLAQAQSAEEAVKAVVNKLFAAMKSADGAGVQAAFSATAVLQTISPDKTGRLVVETDTVAAFANLVSRLKKDSADERVRFETIRIDGPLAIVWAPYSFYYNGKFSHCGVDSFQLVLVNHEWKIQYLIDTRRKTGCRL